MVDQAAVISSRDSAGSTWAWTAVEVAAAVDLSRREAYARLPEQERLERALEDQAGYVQRLLGSPGETTALRWVSDGTGGLQLFLLGRVHDQREEAAVSRARALAARMADTPDHVVTELVTDEAVLRQALVPFRVGAGGLAQVHKQVRVATPSRRDARVHRYVAVEPFSRTRVSWTPLLERLRTCGHPVSVSVDLEATAVPAELRNILQHEATRYRQLSEATERPMDLGVVRYPADAAAAALSPLYQDALGRYGDRCFSFSLTVAAPVPLDPGLIEDVARVVSPQQRSKRPDAHDPLGLRTGYAVLRPDPGQQAGLADGFAGLRPWALPDPVLEEQLGIDRVTPEIAAARAPLRVLRTVVDVTEALSLFRLPVAADGHVPGLRVAAPGDRVRRLPQTTGPSLLLGHQGGQRDPAGEVRYQVSDLPRHGFIVGTPGSGKTNTALHLCRQLWQQGVPFTVIEPVNAGLDDYRWLATLDGFDDLAVFTVGDDSVAPFRLNPFQVPDGGTVSAHISNLLACFEAAFGLWDPLPFLYRRALIECYRRRDLYLDDRGGRGSAWPVLGDFVDAIGQVTRQLGYEGEIGANIDAAATLRAQSLAEGACGPVLDCRTSFDIGLLMRRPVVFELAGVGDNAKEQSLVTLLLINAMRGHYRNARGRDEPPHVIFLEEAHRVFPRATPQNSGDQKEGNAQALAAERIAQGLAEDRKYRQSYLLIDQQVGKVAEDAYKITNLKVMHRTAADEDRKLLGSTMSMHEDQVQAAAALAPFEALVSHNGLDRAVSLTVPDVRAQHAEQLGLAEAPLADDDELRARHRSLLAAQPTLAEAMAPFDECAPCRHRCQFRTRAASLTRDRGLSEQIVTAVMDEEARERPADEAAAELAGLLPWPARLRVGLPEATGTAALEDYRLCAWIHAYRAVYPPTGWVDDAQATATEWAGHAAEVLAGGRPR